MKCFQGVPRNVSTRTNVSFGNKPILAQCSVSTPIKNVKKPLVFSYFQGVEIQNINNNIINNKEILGLCPAGDSLIS